MLIGILIYILIAGAFLIKLGLSDDYGNKYSYWRTLGMAGIWPVSVPYVLSKKYTRDE